MCNLPIDRFSDVVVGCPECFGYLLGKPLPGGLAVYKHFPDIQSVIDYTKWLIDSCNEVDGVIKIPKYIEDAFRNGEEA